MNITDFQEGGAKRRFITHTDILPMIDEATEMTNELEQLIKKHYTMNDNYLVDGDSTDNVEGVSTIK